MSNIISYTDLAKFDFKNKTQNVLIIRGYHKYDPHKFYTVQHEALLACGSDWVQLSKNFHEAATLDVREDFVPEVSYNLMADKNCCYAKIVDKLADKFNFDSLGINSQNTPTQNGKALDKIIASAAFQKLDTRFKSLITNLRTAAKEHTGQKFFLENDSFSTCLIESDIKSFFKTQMIHTGKYQPDDIIVLFGDNEVKRFIESNGSTLLKEIKTDMSKGTNALRREAYLNGYYEEALEELFNEDLQEVDPQAKFPKAYKAFSNRHNQLENE